VVIIGRPNVGKSSLFNWLVGRRIAIVDDVAGVTRDRVTFLLEREGRYFELVDTGGMGMTDTDNLSREVEEQINAAIDEADLLLFVVDAQAGILPLDKQISDRLRLLPTPLCCVVNKCDSPARDAEADEFYRLGRRQLIRVSTKADRNRDELLDMIRDNLPAGGAGSEAIVEPEMKLAIVGRRNVGKSTFVNTLVKADRMIVSEVPGTTRDSVDVRFESDGKAFVAIDTPGLRRSVSVRTDVDFYGVHRAKRSIRRADVVLIFFDATQPIGKVDKQLCSYVAEQYKPCIFVVNKWDLMVDKIPTGQWVDYLHDTFRSMRYVPIAFVTGKTGKNVRLLLNHAQALFKQSRQRVTTAPLNNLLKQALAQNPPPLYRNRRPKVYYAAQIGVQPPTIVLVCNQPKAFPPTYRRYLLNAFRAQLSFAEVPIKLYLHRRSPTDQRDELGTAELAG
jgi:GTP-binding protein